MLVAAEVEPAEHDPKEAARRGIVLKSKRRGQPNVEGEKARWGANEDIVPDGRCKATVMLVAAEVEPAEHNPKEAQQKHTRRNHAARGQPNVEGEKARWGANEEIVPDGRCKATVMLSAAEVEPAEHNPKEAQQKHTRRNHAAVTRQIKALSVDTVD